MGLILCLLSLVLLYFSPAELLPAVGPYHLQQLILFPAVAVSLISFVMRSGSLQWPQDYLMIGLWFAIVMSTLSKLMFHASLSGFTDFGLVVCLYFLVTTNVFTARRIRVLCGVLSACAGVMAVEGILAYHTGFLGDKLIYLHIGEGFQVFRRVRALGVLNDPNDFGQFLVVGIALLGVFYKKQRVLTNLIALGIPTAVMFYAIYLTGSRGVAFGLAAIPFVLVSSRFGALRAFLLAAVMLVLLFALRFGGGREMSLQEGRVMMWGSGIAMLKGNPLFGVGYAHFGEHSDLTAHNSFVLCFAELGLFGYFFWLALIMVAVLSLQRMTNVIVKKTENPELAGLVTSLRGALFGFLATSWFLSRTYNPTLFVLLAMVAVLVRLRREEDPKLEIVSSRWIPATVAFQFVSVMVIYATVRLRSF